jgi:hypothetical protein
MRNYVAILLIVCGTLLAIAPIVSDFAQAVVISQALGEPRVPGTPFFFRQPLEESYRLGCWILGGTMISLGIIGACRRHQIGNPYADREHVFAKAAG